MKKIIFVLPHFRSGAIPNIIWDIHPFLKKSFKVKLVILGSASRDDQIYDLYQKEDIEIKDLNCSKFQLYKSIRKLKKFLENENPDIVHSHLGRADIIASLATPKSTVLMSTFHNIRGGYHPITRVLYKFIDNRAVHRTCVSEAVLNSWYGEYGLSSDKSVIYNPVNIQSFVSDNSTSDSIRNQLSIGIENTILISVGSLTKQKGHEYLIEAIAKVKESNDKITLLLVGRGPLENKLKKKVSEMGLNNQIKFLGFRHDIPLLLKESDIFVFPSIWEGLGIAVLEAMTSKTPVVGSSCPAIEEYIINGESGLLSAPKDVSTLANNILNLIKDTSLQKRITNVAYQTVIDKFEASKIAADYLNLYNRYLN